MSLDDKLDHIRELLQTYGWGPAPGSAEYYGDWIVCDVPFDKSTTIHIMIPGECVDGLVTRSHDWEEKNASR